MDKLVTWSYCPVCSSSDLIKDCRRYSCSSCSFCYYCNIASAVAVIIEFEDNIILTRRAKDPCRGMLDLPGGFVDCDESAEAALLREVKEELNITTLANLTYLTSAPNKYLYKNVEYPVLDLIYISRVSHLDNITPQDDVCGYKLIKPQDLHLDEIAFSSTKVGLTRYMQLRGAS